MVCDMERDALKTSGNQHLRAWDYVLNKTS